jgi:uncharacterized repeat protein (TIGR03806 family)
VPPENIVNLKPYALGVSLLVSAAGGCSSSDEGGAKAPAPALGTCKPAEVSRSYVDAPFQTLAEYCLLDLQGGEPVYREGVVPYGLNSELFSDYAIKSRGVFLPPGTAATYSETESWDLPVGTVIAKTFSFPDDFTKDSPVVTAIETRLLIRTNDGWKGYPYRWNAEQTQATLKVAGELVDLSFVGHDGESVSTTYLIPNSNQCKKCHEFEQGTMGTIGLRARHVNRDFTYPDGTTENQIAHFARLGLLTGAPADTASAPRLRRWDDPEDGSVDERARSWLDVNCAHCHNPKGPARTSGLFLPASETAPEKFGICKAPVAAGKGSGGLSYDIVPGAPSSSILIYRVSSTLPDVAMPELGRSLVNREAVELLRAWIAGMPGDCNTP